MTSVGTKMVKRDYSLDSVCGVLILYMIFHHSSQFSGTTNDILYTTATRLLGFFMAWFYFKSGMFHKTQKSVKNVIASNCRKFLVPFFVYTIIGEFVRFFFELRSDIHTDIAPFLYSSLVSIIRRSSTTGNMALWFLLSLFFVKCIVSVFERFSLPMFSMCIFSLAFFLPTRTLVLSLIDPKTPWVLWQVSLGMFFYSAGCCLKNIQYTRPLFVLSLFVYVILLIFCRSSIDFRSGNLTHGYYTLYMIQSIAGIITFNNIFKLEWLQIPMFKSIGKDSLYYYSLHWIVLTVVVNLMGGGKKLRTSFCNFYGRNPYSTSNNVLTRTFERIKSERN